MEFAGCFLVLLLMSLQWTTISGHVCITEPPQDQTGVIGGVISFICRASGDPKPTFEWHKNGKRINGRHTRQMIIDVATDSNTDNFASVLRIQPLHKRDQAMYSCIVNNDIAAHDSADVTLHVLKRENLPVGFPKIEEHPTLKAVERGTNAIMRCKATGFPEPHITWIKDFVPLDVDKDEKLSLVENGSLLIQESGEVDEGRYQCVASNNKGTAYSLPSNLYVRVRRIPPHFTIRPDNVYEVTPGDNLSIPCIAEGSPMPSVKWWLEGRGSNAAEEISIGRSILKLTNISESRAYVCAVESALGSQETIARVVVQN